ncbi:ATP-binding protein [Cytophagaceae bacterium ABcell3]|nr:ATP-binding protein [Cytophagaceae bacterium ABcell3]
MKINISKTLPIGVGIIFLLLFYSIYLSFVSSEQAKENFAMVEYTYNVINHVQQIEENLVRAESNARAYYITDGREELLQNFHGNVAQIHENTAMVKYLTRQQIPLQKIIDSLEMCVNVRIKKMNNMIGAVGNPAVDSDSIFRIYQSATEINYRINSLFNQIEDYELDLLQQRQAKTEDQAVISRNYLLITTFGAFFIAIIFVYLIRRDIKGRQKVEQDLRALNQNKNKFFSIISHDLRGPIYAAKQLWELLNQSKEDKDRQQISTMLENSINKVALLLEELLEWSKAQMDKTEHNPKPLNIKATTSEVIDKIQPMATKKNIRAINHVQDYQIFADHYMVCTVIRNLLNNSIKFSQESSNIYIESEKKEKHLLVSIRDEGIGMDEKTLNKLFKVGSQITTKGTQMEEGSGLGLLLCKDFVEKNGGKIWAESQKGEGATFKFTVPLYNG